MSVVFVDCETTGLDPDRHEIWELAIIDESGEVEYQLPVNLARADPTGLRVGRFYERRRAIHSMSENYGSLCRVRHNDQKWLTGLPQAYYANDIAARLDGCHVVGAVPSFDAAFLTRFLNAHGQAATWHYHLIDVEALAVGYLYGEGSPMTGELPWNSDSVSRGVGVDPDLFDRHTALGDARWAKAIYEAVTR